MQSFCAMILTLGVLIVLCVPLVALAQEGAPATLAIATDAVKSTLIDNVLKALLGVLPVVLAFSASYVTHGIQALTTKMSATTLAIMSTVAGSFICSLCAALFPNVLPPDVAAVLGAGGGAASHALSQKSPIPTA